MRNRFLSILFFLTLLLPSIGAAGADSPRRRFAVIVGANDGGAGRLLRHAVSDARAFVRVMEMLGGVAEADRALLENPGPTELRAALVTAAARTNEARLAGATPELVFYYSGHSDEEGLLVRGERVPYRELHGLLDGVPAELRVTVLDSCASGSFTRTKGGVPVSPFLADRSTRAKGDAVLTSSTATEASQESDRLGSSFFTHHLLSGLRGAADFNRDAKVTLNEVYQFAFNETVARTERTRAGAQHPAYDLAVAGTGDVVLSDLRATTALLVLPESLVGHLFLRNAQGALVIELRKETGAQVQLALEPGPYEATLVQKGDVSGGRVTLAETAPVVLDVTALSALPAEMNPLRGEAAEAAASMTLWHNEVRFDLGADLSDSPTAGLTAGLPLVGASYFLRPLVDDHVTPFSLLRFFQRPDEIAVSLSPFVLQHGFRFAPEADIGFVTFAAPWIGFKASLGVSQGTSEGSLGYRARAGVILYPIRELRLDLGLLAQRNQTGAFADGGLIRFAGSADGLASARLKYVLGYRWTFEGGYQLQVSRGLLEGGGGTLVAHQAHAGFAHHFGRYVSFGVTLRGSTYRGFALEGVTDPNKAARSYDVLVLPKVEWFMRDNWLLTVAVGPGVQLQGDASGSVEPHLAGAFSLGVTARF